MEFPAASALRGCVPWLGLLLAIFLLTLWIPPTTAQFDIVSTIALEGQDVILRLRNTPPDDTGFIWYRGIEMKYHKFIGSLVSYSSEYLTGPKYSGREEITIGGHLIIKNVTVWDRGNYTVITVLPKSRSEIGFGRLRVSRPVSVPTLLASITTVTENEDAVFMTCNTDESSTNWLFNATSLGLRERMKLTKDHRILLIDPVRREDAGSYQCKVSNPFSTAESAPVELDVKYYSSAPVWLIRDMYKHNNNNNNKQLKVDSNVSYRFFFFSNEKSKVMKLDLMISSITDQSSFSFPIFMSNTVNILWNKITLRTIGVRGTLSVPTLLASNTTVTENEDAVFMTCYTDESSTNWLFNAMSLRLRERMKLSQDHRTLTIDPVRREDAGNYQCKVSNPVSSTESAPVELDV
uniref:Ig-like domain-containing protein n=1 Tax=Myotis lucifugus TaxID=59463 RepID=G1QAB8_MYOLU